MSSDHLIGLLLGTEEDWPHAFETLLGRVGPVKHEGTTHNVTSERITIEPFNLRAKPRYDLVVDRLAWWYFVPREWLKKVALMDDVYLLNSPVHVPGDGEARGLLRDAATRAEGPQDRADPAQEPAREHALRVHGGEVQPALRPRRDRRADRLPAVHEALRRRAVGRRHADQGRGDAAQDLRRIRRAADAPAGVDRGVRQVRAVVVDRRRDDGDGLPPRRADAQPLRGHARLPDAGDGRRDPHDLAG